MPETINETAVSAPGAGAVPRERLAGARVLVVGDVMLDRYWFGDVNRISPEAPVPVVHVQKQEDRLGGAANVARNAVALGAQAGLLCVVGHDEPGERIIQLLDDSGVMPHLERDPDLLTTIKLRVLSRQQQLLRVDFENTPAHEVLLASLARFDPRRDPDVRLRQRWPDARHENDCESACGRQAGAGGSEGRRLGTLPRRDPDYTQSRRVARGGRAMEVRRRSNCARDEVAYRTQIQGTAADAFGRGHDALLG
jgi:hypothetical protein